MTFRGSRDIVTIEDARAYLKSRAKDAVACFRENHLAAKFDNPIDLAQFLARYW